jgi:hypothetical protein
MPVGLQLAARHGLDEHLLRVGLACEGVLGSRAQRIGKPPLLPRAGRLQTSQALS